MDFRVIKNPSKATIEILIHRMRLRDEFKSECFDSIGLVQGKMIDMIVASDIAQKAVGVTVMDVQGSCPQNMILLALFGETSAVESAMQKIKTEIEKPPYTF